MKVCRKMIVLLLSLCLAGSLSLNVCAARNKEYTYTVRLFAGSHGTFSNGEKVLVYENVGTGPLPFGLREATSMVQMEENSKYYIQGVRESGKDNSDTGKIDVSEYAVTEDQDYVIAYGIKGNQVEYTVRFEDVDGNTLALAETYYGNVGDRPVVAFIYIDGYLPQAYNLTGTLQSNPADNVFTFVYSPVSQEAAAAGAAAAAAAGGTTTPAATPAAAPAATPVPAGAADAAAAEAAADVEGVQPEELMEIGDEETPLANPDEEDNTETRNLEDERTPLGRGEFANMLIDIPTAAKAGILSVLILAGAGGGALYVRRKRKSGNAK